MKHTPPENRFHHPLEIVLTLWDFSVKIFFLGRD